MAWVFFISVVLLYLFSLLHPLYALNQDLGRFMAITEEIVTTRSIPIENTFSYTHPQFEFVHSHWLGGVLLTLIVSLVGFKGLIIVKTLFLLVAFLLSLFTAYKESAWRYRGYKIGLVALVSFPLVLLLLERTHARPEMVSYLFFSLLLVILTGRKMWPLWMIPFVMLLWVNVHIYFIVGFLLVGAYFLDALWREGVSVRTKTLFGVGVLSFFLTLLNPSGLEGLLYPFRVFANYGYTIVENQTPFFLIPFGYNHPMIATLFVVIGVLFVSFLFNWKRVRVADVLVALGLSYLSLSAIRNVTLFALGVLPILVYNISSLRFSDFGIENEDAVREGVTKLFKGVMVIGLLLSLVLAFFALSRVSLSTEAHMKGAVDFIEGVGIEGRMFNNFDIGGYLIYRLYPERKVFVDNRPEAYPAEFFESVYKPMQENPEVWREMVARYDISYVIFGITDQTPWGQNFLQIITSDPNWSIVYVDAYGLVALRNDVENNKGIIERHGKTIY